MEVRIPSGFKIGHCDDQYTSVTVILNESEAKGDMD